MIRQPPKSALFPCPTLFRSVGVQAEIARPPHHPFRARLPELRRQFLAPFPVRPVLRVGPVGPEQQMSVLERSEEHTSELQSRQYLVCRLLLEKKKQSKHTPI